MLKSREHQAVGSRSNIDASGTFKALHTLKRRAALTRFVPFSYFWICWKETPSSLPRSDCLRLRARRCSQIRLPMNLSIEFDAFGEVDLRLAFFIISWRVGSSNSRDPGRHAPCPYEAETSLPAAEPSLCVLREGASRRLASSPNATCDRSFPDKRRRRSCRSCRTIAIPPDPTIATRV